MQKRNCLQHIDLDDDPSSRTVLLLNEKKVHIQTDALEIETDLLLQQQITDYFKTSGDFRKIPSDHFTSPKTSLTQLARGFTSSEVTEFPGDLDEYTSWLQHEVLPYAINTSAPTFIGHMTSALPGYLHDLSKLISKLNQNVVKIETSKSITFLEREAIGKLHRMFFNLPSQFYNDNIQRLNANLGIVTSGGSTANISALLSARNKVLYDKFKDTDPEREVSVFSRLRDMGYKDMVIMGTKLMHYSMQKAANLLGLGKANVVYINNDECGRMCPADLQEKIHIAKQSGHLILAVIGVAGSTERGSIDPLNQIGDITRKNNIHFHVDAAWGGGLIFSQKYRHLISGIDKADSITFCGHKQLYLPQGISMCLFKDPHQLNFNSVTANYQANSNSFDMGRFTIEGSRPALSICLHASLSLIGRRGYELLINNGISLANVFARMVHAIDGFELISNQINIINYRYIPVAFRSEWKSGKLSADMNSHINEANLQLQENQFNNGKTFVSRTLIDHWEYGKIVVLRAVLSNPLTTNEDLIHVIQDQLHIISRYLQEENECTIRKMSFNHQSTLETAMFI